jgi:hypothetical protein
MLIKGVFCSIFLPVIFLLSGCGESNDKGPPNQGFSMSMEESKAKGVFEFQVVNSKSNLATEIGHTLEIKNAWVEKLWWSQVHMIGATSVEKAKDNHQLIMTYKIIPGPQKQKLYYFVGSKPIGDSIVHYSCDRIDTIRVPVYRSTSPFFPSRKNRKAFDSLVFIRR